MKTLDEITREFMQEYVADSAAAAKARPAAPAPAPQSPAPAVSRPAVSRKTNPYIPIQELKDLDLVVAKEAASKETIRIAPAPKAAPKDTVKAEKAPTMKVSMPPATKAAPKDTVKAEKAPTVKAEKAPAEQVSIPAPEATPEEIALPEPSPEPAADPILTDEQLRAFNRKHLLMIIRDLEIELQQAKKERDALLLAYKAGLAKKTQAPKVA